MPYRYEWTVSVGQTDFSGRIYTPELVDCLAEGLERMMCEVGYGPKRAFEEGIVYPVVHTEAEYLTRLLDYCFRDESPMEKLIPSNC